MTIPHDPTGGGAVHVHRLLDEAFAGIEMDPDRQDLKEEMRGNLLARVAELEAAGLTPQAAAGRAVGELGDVRDILGHAQPRTDAAGRPPERVRPSPAFGVRTVVLSAVALAGLAVPVLAATLIDVPLAAQAAAVAVVAAALGAVTADALRQETTSNHPMPGGRAAGYGAGVLLALCGLGAAWLSVRAAGLPWLVTGVLLVVTSAALFTYLGVTQTNRHKDWVVRLQTSHAAAGDRFTEDPAAAARFGLYTATVCVLVVAAFVALTLTVGWAWSWLAVVAGLVVMLVMIARMLFAPHP